jgi:hypothetical protein
MTETVLKNTFSSLDIMWKGMLGLFIVCGAVAVIMMIITRFLRKRPSEKGEAAGAPPG